MQNIIQPLVFASAKDLLTQSIEPFGFTVDAILPHSLFILAGSSKSGKSLSVNSHAIKLHALSNYHAML